MKRRLEQAQAKLAETRVPSARQEQDILKQRAEKLAAPPPLEQEKGDMLTVVEFRLGPERYGLECSFVAEVLVPGSITPLPGTPAFWAGIMDVRGRIAAVVSLDVFFKIPAAEITPLTRVILLGGEDEKGGGFGILTGELLGTLTIPLQELQPVPPTLTGIGKKYIKGVTTDRLVLLNAGKLLSDPDLTLNRQSAAAAGSPGAGYGIGE